MKKTETMLDENGVITLGDYLNNAYVNAYYRRLIQQKKLLEKLLTREINLRDQLIVE